MGATNEAFYSFQKVDRNASEICPWKVQYRSQGTGHTTGHRPRNNSHIRRLWRSCSRVSFPRFPALPVHPVLHRLACCSGGEPSKVEARLSVKDQLRQQFTDERSKLEPVSRETVTVNNVAIIRVSIYDEIRIRCHIIETHLAFYNLSIS